MKKSCRFLAFLMVIVLCMVSVTCALGEDKKEPVKLRVLWCQGTNTSGMEDYLDEKLAEEYPYITAEWEIITWEDLPSKMQQYMQSGMPDVVVAKSQDANNYGKYGVWADLSGTDYIHSTYESTLPGVTIDGKILGLPYIGTYGGVYYNKAVFEKCGITIPKTPEELDQVCKTLKENGVTPFATHWLDAWFIGWEVAIVTGNELMSHSLAWGNEFRDGKRNATDDDFKAGIQLMDCIAENTWEDTFSVEQTTCDARFVKGEAAMQMDLSGVALNYSILDPEFDYGIFPFPNTNGDGCLNMEPNDTFFKSASTEHSDAVDDFMRLVSSAEVASHWCQYSGESSLIKGAVSFDMPAQSDIDSYSAQGLSRDQNAITNQLPYNAFWAEVSNDYIEYRNGQITLDTLYERANERRGVCGQ